MPPSYLPHIDLLLHALRIPRDRLNGRGKIAIDAPLLRALLQESVAHLPFSPAFYRAAYPDIAAAEAAGQIPDLHRHFVETGYFEGRHGAPPPLDEAYYAARYPDVAQAIARGETGSGAEHSLRAGAAEGRATSAAAQADTDRWLNLLRIHPGIGA